MKHDKAVRFYTVREVAGMLRVHRQTIYDGIREGEIPTQQGIGVYRIPVEWVEAKTAPLEVHRKPGNIPSDTPRKRGRPRKTV